MADLPDSVAQHFMSELVASARNTSDEARAITTIAAGVLKTGAAKRATELDPAESRSVSGVLATPIASPTTQAGG